MTFETFWWGVVVTLVGGLLIKFVQWVIGRWNQRQLKPHRDLLKRTAAFLMRPVKDSFDTGGSHLNCLWLAMEPDRKKGEGGPMAVVLENGPDHPHALAAREHYLSVKDDLHQLAVKLSAEGPSLRTVSTEVQLLDKALWDLLQRLSWPGTYDGSCPYEALRNSLQEHRLNIESKRRSAAGEVGYLLHGTDRSIGSRFSNWRHFRSQAWRKMREYSRELEFKERREAGYRQLDKK